MFFALAAVLDWVAVERQNKRLEYVAKPAATLILLITVAVLPTVNVAEETWFVAALALCLVGDVSLMLPRDLFVLGLSAFLFGHICFLGGFLASNPNPSGWFFLVALVLAFVIPRIAAPIIRGARNESSALVAPVLVYIVALVLLVLVAAATGRPIALAGAAVFVLSDSILATNRFVRPLPHGHLATMVTYHAALALLVFSLR